MNEPWSKPMSPADIVAAIKAVSASAVPLDLSVGPSVGCSDFERLVYAAQQAGDREAFERLMDFWTTATGS